jgi:hypothetical protein
MQKIITRETFKNFTKINNNNNNNNNNNFNDNNTNDCVVLADSPTIEETESVTPAGASGLASLSGVGISVHEILPRNWRGFKLDLFANPAMKLKASVIKDDGTTQELVAALNSPVEYIWRGVPNSELNTSHWQLVKQIQTELETLGIAYWSSKFSTPRKGSSTKFVVFLYETKDTWELQIVIKASVYEYSMNKESNLTLAQRKGNMIATHFVGKTQKKLLDVEDLGL